MSGSVELIEYLDKDAEQPGLEALVVRRFRSQSFTEVTVSSTVASLVLENRTEPRPQHFFLLCPSYLPNTEQLPKSSVWLRPEEKEGLLYLSSFSWRNFLTFSSP